MAVGTPPGCSAYVWIVSPRPSSSISSCSVDVARATAALLELYPMAKGKSTVAARDAMLMITPDLRSRMDGRTAQVVTIACCDVRTWYKLVHTLGGSLS